MIWTNLYLSLTVKLYLRSHPDHHHVNHSVYIAHPHSGSCMYMKALECRNRGKQEIRHKKISRTLRWTRRAPWRRHFHCHPTWRPLLLDAYASFAMVIWAWVPLCILFIFTEVAACIQKHMNLEHRGKQEIKPKREVKLYVGLDGLLYPSSHRDIFIGIGNGDLSLGDG